MRAWIIEEQAKIEERPLKLVEVPMPHPQDSEVRLRILACGVCRTDIHIAEGDLPLKKSPIILGNEIVGIVDEIGKNVSRFDVGDNRIGNGIDHRYPAFPKGTHIDIVARNEQIEDIVAAR